MKTVYVYGDRLKHVTEPSPEFLLNDWKGELDKYDSVVMTDYEHTSSDYNNHAYEVLLDGKKAVCHRDQDSAQESVFDLRPPVVTFVDDMDL